MEVILDFENFYLPDFETSFEVLCEFKSGHICTNYVHRTSISVINKFYANFFIRPSDLFILMVQIFRCKLVLCLQ